MPEDSYKMIEAARDRAIDRTGDTFVYKPEDMVAKIEYEGTRETYENGFRDYHGPERKRERPNG